MKNKLTLFFCCIGLLFFGSSCEKEYSTEYGGFTTGTNSGSAVYSYVGTPICTNPDVKGTYTAGAVTTIANAVIVQVDVQTPGTYLISTATINGVTFKGSGTFSVTGVQNLNLLATGTPVGAGTFIYIPGTNGCSFDVTFLSGSASTSTFTFADAPNACTAVTVNGTYQAGELLTSSNSISGIQVNVTKTGTWFLSTLPNNGVTFSGSGTFTTTGLQTISLAASGTPITSGPFTYSPGNNGCSFTVNVLPAIVLPSDYVKCTIDSVTTVFGDAAFFTETTIAAQPPAPSANTVDITADVTPGGETFEISLTKTSSAVASGDVFDINGLTKGKLYSVIYTNANFMSWSAITGVSLTPFTVTITSKTATRIQGKFSGTLSDTGLAGGNTKVVTNGTFSVPVH